MSMHKIPLTQLEEDGLRAHGLDIGSPSQLSDVFRHGIKWALEQTALSAVTAERDGLAAARMAYANEFAPDENGDPDVGNVHANIRALKAERDRLRGTVEATYEWLDKTEWVQKTAKAHELGKHRADVLKDRIDQLRAEVERLTDAAGKAIAWLDAEQNESGLGIYRRIKLCRDAENSLRAAVATQAGEL